MTNDERARAIIGLCALAKWPRRRFSPWPAPPDFDADPDPGICPAITTALVEHYLASDLTVADIGRELCELTAREDERIGELPSYRPKEDHS